MKKLKQSSLILTIVIISLAALNRAIIPSTPISRAAFDPALITPTPLPPVNPTPFGGPIVVGTPLPTPELSPNAINPTNALQLIETTPISGSHSVGISELHFTDDGLHLVAVWDDLKVWQFPDANIIHSISLTGTSWTPFTLSPDGQIAALGNHENLGWVELWNITTKQRARQHQGGQQVRALDFNATGTLLAANRVDGSVTVWDVETGHLRHQLQNGWNCYGMAFHPELDQIAASATGNTIHIWDAWSGILLDELTMPNPPALCQLSSIAYRPDGQMIAAAMFWEHSIALWEGNTFVGTLTHPDAGTIWQIGWSPDGQLLAAIENGDSQGPRLVLWDVANQNVIDVWEQWRSVAAFSPDGASLVTYTRGATESHLGFLTLPSQLIPMHYLYFPVIYN